MILTCPLRFKNGQEVRADARIKISRDCTRLETYNLTLNLIKREDAGDYEVKATNTLGSASTLSHVKVLSKLFRFEVQVVALVGRDVENQK